MKDIDEYWFVYICVLKYVGAQKNEAIRFFASNYLSKLLIVAKKMYFKIYGSVESSLT